MNDKLTDLVQATPPVGVNTMLLAGIPLAQPTHYPTRSGGFFTPEER